MVFVGRRGNKRALKGWHGRGKNKEILAGVGSSNFIDLNSIKNVYLFCKIRINSIRWWMRWFESNHHWSNHHWLCDYFKKKNQKNLYN